MAHFDRWAPSYDDCVLRPLYDAAHRAVLDALRSGTHRPRRILDVGCGSGRMLRHAAALFPDATRAGMDLSLGMLHVAAHAGVGRFVNAAVEELAFADAAFRYRDVDDLDAPLDGPSGGPQPNPPAPGARRPAGDRDHRRRAASPATPTGPDSVRP